MLASVPGSSSRRDDWLMFGTVPSGSILDGKFCEGEIAFRVAGARSPITIPTLLDPDCEDFEFVKEQVTGQELVL